MDSSWARIGRYTAEQVAVVLGQSPDQQRERHERVLKKLDALPDSKKREWLERASGVKSGEVAKEIGEHNSSVVSAHHQ